MVTLYIPEIFEAATSNEDVWIAIDDSCERIHKATKGWGTDEKGLIDVMGSLSPYERLRVIRRYPMMYGGKELEKLMKEECGGDFGDALQLLAVPCDQADAKIIRKSTRGLGTSEHLLYPVICGRTNDEMDLLKKTWFLRYGSDLTQVLASELSGNLERIVVACLQGIEEVYDEGYHTQEKAEEDAEKFYEAGQGRWGTNEKVVFQTLCQSPPEHLRQINSAYADKYGYTLSKALEKELDGNVRDAALYHLNMKIKPYETAAAEIKKVCAGFGTDEYALTACIVRYQTILRQVDEAHIKAYDKSIIDRINSEVRGDYRKILIVIVENTPYHC